MKVLLFSPSPTDPSPAGCLSLFTASATAVSKLARSRSSIGGIRARSFARLLMGALLLCGAATANAQVLVADPSPLVFPDQQVGTQSAPLTLTWRNTSNQAVTVDAQSTVAPGFAPQAGTCGSVPFTLAAQATCIQRFLFLPSAERQYTDVVTLSRNGAVVGQVNVVANGVVGELSVSPGLSVSFPATPVGTTSATRTIELISVRSGRVQVSGITAANAPFARVGGSCGTPPFPLDPGQRCSLIYAYSPVQIGTGQQQMLTMSVPPAYGPSWFVTLRGDATQGNQTITFPAQAARTYAPGYSFPVDPPATANSGLAVVYGSTSTAVCTVSGSMVAVVAAGTCTLTASQSGNASWAAATQQTRSFAIARASQTLTFPAQTASSRSFVPGGTFAIAPTATSVTPNAGQPIVYSSLDASVCTVSGSTVTMVSAGACNLAANQAGNTNYNAAGQVTTRVQLALFAHGFETLP